MTYHGRIVVAGMTKRGEPFAAYAISGRSAFSKQRKFTSYESAMKVDAVGNLTPDQEKMKDFIFYNAMRQRNGILIVTNGAQTDLATKDGKPIINFYNDFDLFNSEASSAIMNEWGYEKDEPIFTPRIAVVRFPNANANFSIVSFNDEDPQKCPIALSTNVKLGRGTAKALATYQGLDDAARPWRFYKSSDLNSMLFDMNFSGETPMELAEELYYFLDPRYVVSAAGAVLSVKPEDISWTMDIKNRFETEAGFDAFLAEAEKK